MLPSVVPVLGRKSKTRRRSIRKSEKVEYLRETSPDSFGGYFEELEVYIKTRLDIGTSLPLVTAFGSSVSTRQYVMYTCVLYYGTMYIAPCLFIEDIQLSCYFHVLHVHIYAGRHTPDAIRQWKVDESSS